LLCLNRSGVIIHNMCKPVRGGNHWQIG
jgi:hypothetical protein